MNFEQEIIKELKKFVNGEINLETPKQEFGDYALPCFNLVKEFKKNPNELANEIAKKIKSKYFTVSVVGGYINFKINKEILVGQTIKEILKKKDNYGKGSKKNEKIMVEYSQPNTHKEFHIGHLRNTVIGNALVNILRFNGYNVVAANYINDTGTHVSYVLWIYNKFYRNKEPKKDKNEWLGKLYVEARKKVEDNPEFKKDIDLITKKLENKDKYYTSLWKKTRQYSLEDFSEIYRTLNVKFDAWFYDYQLIEKTKHIIKELLEKKIIYESEGALIVDLEKYGLHKTIIQKSDGTIVYLAKDFALAKEKFTRFKIDKSLHVVGVEQRLHFQQLFKILELYGFKQAKNCYHLAYELVNLSKGKMSARSGNIVTFHEFYDELLRHAIAETGKRNKELNKSKVEKIANNVALSAMKFTMLNQDINKVITFDMKEALSFEGDTGPYLQYTYARASSILRKGKLKGKINFSLLKEEKEIEIVKKLYNFQNLIDSISKNYQIQELTHYMIELAQLFNEFYHSYNVLKAEGKLRNARLALVLCVREVLNSCLNLIGIESLERM